MRRVVRITRVDLVLAGAGALLAIVAAIVVQISTWMVAPPRPRVSESARPVLGITLRQTDGGELFADRVSGPAARAGLAAGDRIVRLDALTSPSLESFATAVSTAPEGTTFTLEARRNSGDGTEGGVLAQATSELQSVTPAEEGLPFETVAFPNAFGLTLRGWYIPPPDAFRGPAPAVIYAHGNGSDRRQWLRLAGRVHEAGMAQLLFDFAGRGDSDGDVISLGEHESDDLRAAIDFLARRRDVDPARIGAVGKSMGGVAAILASAKDARIRALVLDGPFADLADVVDRAIGARHLPAALLRPLVFRVAGWRASFDPAALRPEEAMRDVKAPVLLLHGEEDDLVPFEHALRLERAAAGPLTLIPLPGEGHNTPRSPETLDRIARYLRGTLAP